MTKIDILKSLAPGFLPLIVFILADAIWGTTIGLIVAIVIGIIEVFISYIKEKFIDKFILLDIGLIVVLGVVSIVLDNPIFFKLKPALVELIFCVIIGVSIYSPVNVMLQMSKRYMKNIELGEAQVRQLNRSLKALFYIFIAHTLMIVYSAFFMSKAAWAFVSGGLFYIFFGVYFVVEILGSRFKQKKIMEKYKDEEWFDLVDTEGRVVGKAPRSICHSGPGRLHPVVHLHIVDDRDRIFLQKRATTKQIQPGKWDTAVGGHVSSGENIQQALIRETAEEVGLTGKFPVTLIARYVWETDVESELVHMFCGRYNKTVTIPNTDEIDEGKFWRLKRIKENIGKGVFTPNFEFEFDILLKQIFKSGE